MICRLVPIGQGQRDWKVGIYCALKVAVGQAVPDDMYY